MAEFERLGATAFSKVIRIHQTVSLLDDDPSTTRSATKASLLDASEPRSQHKEAMQSAVFLQGKPARRQRTPFAAQGGDAERCLLGNRRALQNAMEGSVPHRSQHSAERADGCQSKTHTVASARVGSRRLASARVGSRRLASSGDTTDTPPPLSPLSLPESLKPRHNGDGRAGPKPQRWLPSASARWLATVMGQPYFPILLS